MEVAGPEAPVLFTTTHTHTHTVPLVEWKTCRRFCATMAMELLIAGASAEPQPAKLSPAMS